MFSPLMVVAAVALASSSTMAQEECACDISNPGQGDCRNSSLTSIPDCVPNNITILNIYSPSIPLVADTIRRFTNLKSLSLSFSDKPQISKTFLDGQKNISDFYIYFTSLEYVDSDWFLYARRITTLGLAYNKIASLAADTFSSLPLLDTLFLNSNALTTLPPTLFQGTALRNVYLHYNLWHCDCELATFIQWTRDHGVTILDLATCLYPPELEGLDLVDLTTDLACRR